MEDQMKSLQEEINFSLEAILGAPSGNSFSLHPPEGWRLIGWVYHATNGSNYLENTLNLTGSQEENAFFTLPPLCYLF
jgi:hypothetical protein